jgi:DNA-binding NarL/FixJ family response regulator
VLAENAPLLNEMLSRILHKAENVEIVQELHNLEKMPAAPEDARPDWVVISLASDQDTPNWVDGYIAEHPDVGILIFSSDNSGIRLKWWEKNEQELYDLTLSELLQILSGHPQAS